MVCRRTGHQRPHLRPAEMSGPEFILMAIEEWPAFVALSMMFAIVVFMAIRRVIVGGVFDPLVLALVLGYSVNYAVVALLWLMGKSNFLLTALVLGYGMLMLGIFRWISRSRRPSLLLNLICSVTPRRIGPLVFGISIVAYLALSLFIIGSIGFGIFAETNRFDAARGFGAFIRILDFLGPFIVSYSTASIFTSRRRSLMKIFALVMFVMFSAMVNGAKISVIFSLFTVFFTLTIMAIKVRIRPGVFVLGLLAGLAFSMVALSINLKQNNVEENSIETGLTGTGLVVQQFAYRIIASGDSSYLLLPNDVIDKIEKDSALVQFIVPFIGITTASKIFGYPVGDLSVGRQALLYYAPGTEVAGGPTSHFDLFGYVYFGPFGGFLFAAAVGALLGSINRAIRIVRGSPALPPNNFRVAFLATLWTRAVLVIIEPTVALAYIVDVLMFFSIVSVCLHVITRRSKSSMIAAP